MEDMGRDDNHKELGLRPAGCHGVSEQDHYGESGNALPSAHGPEQQGVAVLFPHSGWGNPGHAEDLGGTSRAPELFDRSGLQEVRPAELLGIK